MRRNATQHPKTKSATEIQQRSQIYPTSSKSTLEEPSALTTFILAQSLLAVQAHLIGTRRLNRKGMPTKIATVKLKRGEVISRENAEGILIMNWRDKRDVALL